MITAITGLPGSGKTTYSNTLEGVIFHTDDYIDQCSFKDFPHFMISLLEDVEGPYTIEGVQVARMLRTGYREGIWTPDKVILMKGGNHKNKIASTVTKSFMDWVKESGKDYQELYKVILREK